MNGETSAILTTETVCRPRLTPCSRQADRMAGAGSRIEESAFGSKSIWASTYLTSLNRGPGGALFHRQLPPEIDADSRPQIHLFPSVNGHWQISQQENHHRRQDARYALRWM
jgi:hypothetical protein